MLESGRIKDRKLTPDEELGAILGICYLLVLFFVIPFLPKDYQGGFLLVWFILPVIAFVFRKKIDRYLAEKANTNSVVGSDRDSHE